MRKLLILLTALLVMLCTAQAEEAPNITKKCTIAPSSGKSIKAMWDDRYSSVFSTKEEVSPWLEISAPEGKTISGLYICWENPPSAWVLEASEQGVWTEIAQGGTDPYVHEYMPVPSLSHVRIRLTGDDAQKLAIAELTVLGEGDLPAYVQQWQPTPEKADLLLLSAHPDDEYIFMGGVIPYYAGEKQLDVVVVYMTYDSTMRRSELLNGLWHAGVRTYPVLGEFYDRFTKSLKDAYKLWGEEESLAFVTDIIRTYRPEVMVTHDVNGEYGHGAHRLCADAALRCVPAAAEGENAWQVKKLYLHLYKENRIVMDWQQPLEAFDGKTALQIAREAFRFHRSQQGGSATYKGEKYVFAVEDRGPFNNAKFGLAYTVVGPDTLCNDMFENIPAE